jgi:hypothetical protein
MKMIRKIMILGMFLTPLKLLCQTNQYCKPYYFYETVDTIMSISKCNYYHNYFKNVKDSIIFFDFSNQNDSLLYTLGLITTNYTYDKKNEYGYLTYVLNDTVLIESYELKNGYVYGEGIRYNNLIENNDKVLEKATFRKNKLHGTREKYHFDYDKVILKVLYWNGIPLYRKRFYLD